MDKIAYLIGDFQTGGIPGFLYRLATRLNNQFEFHFIATDNSNINPKFNNVGKAHYFKQHWSDITQYLRDNDIDIVQYGNKIQYKQCAVNAGVPIVIERTAGPRSCHLNRDGVTHVISSTKGTVSLIKTNYTGPVSVIYNGIEIDEYESVVPDRLHFGSDDVVVCYCARMGGRGQGFDILVKAVLQARSRRDIKLVLIGDKPEHAGEDIRPQLRKLAAPMGKDCVFTGELSNPAPIMAGADIYVCPANHHGISNALIEASALGKPIIATDVGQTNEVVHDRGNGFLVSAGDVGTIASLITRIADSPAECKMLGDYGKNLVKQEFNLDTQAEKYRELYMKLLSEAK